MQWVELPAGTVPMIVEPDLWQAAQVIVKSNKARRATHADHAEVHLLRGGLAVCGNCGGSMVADWPNAGSSGYRCGVHKRHKDRCAEGPFIRQKMLDEAVWRRVEAILTDPSLIRQELARMKEAPPDGKQLAQVERGLADIQRKITNLVDQLADHGAAVADAIRAKLAALETQRQRLVAERESLVVEQDEWQASRVRWTTSRRGAGRWRAASRP